MISTPLRRYALLCVIALVVVCVYLPGLGGPFVFDDDINIASNPVVTGHTSDEFPAVPQSNRPLATLSFALNAQLAGGANNPLPFKVTNLAIHVLNTVLIYWLSWLLFVAPEATRNKKVVSREWLPPAIAATWALHPIQLTSVLYIVQRMTSLSATFVLVGLIAFVYGRQRLNGKGITGLVMIWAGLLGGTTVGISAKENGALLIPYALVVEFCFFHDSWRNAAMRRRLYTTYGPPVVLLTILAFLWLALKYDSLINVYTQRDFTLIERLLTEPRVLWFYVTLIVFPDIRRLSLFHDDIALSTSLLTPWTTPLAIAGVIAAISVAFIYRRKYPVLSFSILWFLVGHAPEASFIGLELTHEHRNYLPSYGLIAGAAVGLFFVAQRVNRAAVLTGLIIAIAGCLGFATYVLADVWASKEKLIGFLVTHHPNSPRAHVMQADFDYLDTNRPYLAAQHYVAASDLAPSEAAYLIRTAQITSLTGGTRTNTDKVLEEFDNKDHVPMLEVIQRRDGSRYLRATSALTDTVTQRLRSKPANVRTVQALQELAQCAMSRPPCRPLLSKTIDWHNDAIENPKSTNDARITLLVQLAQLHLENANANEALRAAQRARALDPNQPVLMLMEANIQLIAGNIAAATQLMQTLRERRNSVAPDQWREIEKLSMMIDARQKRRDR